jgi:ribose/xylose/arabinose/galactoside ABC-type transport system permease subunit
LSLVVLFVALAIASPHFLTETNLSSVVRQTAVINIMSLGMTLIIIAGGIDLSVGAMLAMCGVLGTMAMESGMPVPVGILVGSDRVVLGIGERHPDHAAAHRALHRDARHAGHYPRA